jgi:hypothetical protein
VRWATPVLHVPPHDHARGAAARPDVAGGEKVVLFYHSGNRDERAIDRPWDFDVSRDPNRHLGFGGGGPHYCLGASLARDDDRVDRLAVERREHGAERGEIPVHVARTAICTASGP